MMISTHGYVGAEPEFGKPDTGGQVVYVLELSKCLAKMGYQVDILTRRFENQPKAERVADRVKVVRFPCGGKKFIPKETLVHHIPEWVENVMEHIRSKKIQYSFINSHYWDAGVAGQMVANRLGIPHIHTPHSIGSWKRNNMDGEPEGLERKYNFKERIRNEKTVYDECDALIATTPLQRDIVEGEEYDVPSDKVYVVPPGYDDTRFFPVSLASRRALKEQYGFQGKIVLALGRTARNKGYDLLVRSMKVVFDRVPEARLILAAGSKNPNPQEQKIVAELEQIAKELGIQDKVTLADYIPDDELPDYYRLADVFALSSRYEPFGMTAVEAMACGTPTVVTTQGGLWKQVTWGTEAMYEDPFDPESFGHAVRAILQHSRVADQLSKFGSQKARANFTWMGIAQQVLSILQGYRMRPALGKKEMTKEESHEQSERPVPAHQ
jgi:mannosylfructose-phosphate synthase